ncbi:phenylalanine--tRNA ligase subunit beta [Candidatus Uhrbacteria bacterium]|nr:phenylalanine--tRNA ligase subunit beta [Candidatus Uhrbacteria bacterium]
MNLLVSYNWIREYLKGRDSAEQFARKVSLCGPAVERSYPQAPMFDRMVIGRVVGVKPHPNADRLRLAAVEIGPKDSLTLVCGGSNLAVGMKVAVALVGARVRWHGQGDLIELQPASIRGVESLGMVCGAGEIGLAEAFPHAEHEILDLSWCKAKPGTSLAKALGLDDTVFDIEVTTNRPDAFSAVGLAREASAILGCPFTWKEPVLLPMPKSVKPKPLSVRVEDRKNCTRYTAVVMEDISVGPSPWWMKNRLRLAGIRPINNVVDITNYVMLELGQPMHAFDYDRLAGPEIRVRRARKGERIAMLDGREADLDDSMPVIADAERPVAVAGVIGGMGSAVTDGTKTVVFESATFDPVSVRRTARSINAHTDASLRFEKGLPEDQAMVALARAVELCQEVACGRVASPVHDHRLVPAKKVKYNFRPVKAEGLIGTRIPKPQMVRILKSLGFQVSAPHGSGVRARYEVTVPYWRERDIEGERDIVEEIARIYGYHNLPSVIPSGELPLDPPDALMAMEESSRQMLRGAGYTELINYSFVSRELLERTGFDPDRALRLANPLSGDFEFMRPSLIPGMLKAVAENQGLFPEGQLFEASRVYVRQPGAQLPEEPSHLSVLSYGAADPETAFRQARGILEAWCGRLSVRMPELRREADVPSPWHPGRSAAVVFGDVVLGRIGEIHPSVREKFGIDRSVTALEVDLTGILSRVPRTGLKYVPPPTFPAVRRDLAFAVRESVDYADIESAVRASGCLLREIEPFDIYRGKGVEAGHKSLALHLEFAREDRTLTAEEVDREMSAITGELSERFGATVRG